MKNESLCCVHESDIPCKPYARFSKAEMDERGLLYRQIAERIWNPEDLLREGDA